MIVFAVLTLSAVLTAGASEPAPAMPHIRSSAPLILGALDEGAVRSPFFRALMDRLNGSDVIVHVVWDLRPRSGVAGLLTFVAEAGGVRYCRIFVSPALGGADLVAVLGHELEHAVEIADRPWITSQPDMRAFYASAGIACDVHGEVYDTNEAVEAGDRVRLELLESRHMLFTPDSRARHGAFIR